MGHHGWTALMMRFTTVKPAGLCCLLLFLFIVLALTTYFSLLKFYKDCDDVSSDGVEDFGSPVASLSEGEKTSTSEESLISNSPNINYNNDDDTLSAISDDDDSCFPLENIDDDAEDDQSNISPLISSPVTLGGSNGRRQRGMIISNLPKRHSNNSLREGLFHNFKHFGKIINVIVRGESSKRRAVITFERSDDAHSAMSSAKSAKVLGSYVKCLPHKGYGALLTHYLYFIDVFVF